jgi:fibronectin type 3 domain-containing protein
VGAASGLAVVLAGCGYVGEPLPPLANIPARVIDLAAVQRGSRIIVQFSVPSLTTETKPIPGPIKLDLRAGTAEHFEEFAWSVNAQRIPEGEVQNGIARYEIPSGQWTGKAVILGARVEAANRKSGAWSNFVTVPVVPAPETPADVKAVATGQGLRLTWAAAGSQFRVLRKAEGGTDFALVATVEKPEWTDAEIEYGKQYTYLVQTVVKVEENRVAESELSAEQSIKPIDTFPPAAPGGLHATVGPASIELSWDPNTEADLVGYRVYRSAAGGAFEKIADVAAVPSYSDKAIKKDTAYRYQVSAVDRAGNESARSALADAQ